MCGMRINPCLGRVASAGGRGVVLCDRAIFMRIYCIEIDEHATFEHFAFCMSQFHVLFLLISLPFFFTMT